jgi:FkbM family methyltransferase
MKTLFGFFKSHPLSGPSGLFALSRFFRWQLKSRISEGVHIHKWIDNSKFYVSRGETGLTGNIYVGLHEFSDMSFLLHLLRPSDYFVDVGSNSGSYTILASSVVRAKSISIEPVPSTFDRLLLNIELNQIGHLVEAKNVALSSESGCLRVTVGTDTTNHLVTEGSIDGTEIVDVLTLDEVTTSCAPTLIKIDVEGWEFKVLEGGHDCLKDEKLKAIIIEINGNAVRLGFDDSMLVDRLSNLGFESFHYEPFSRVLTRTYGKNLSSGNTIFIRDLLFVQDRVATAENRKVLGKVI